ncbi:hypothetical protein [Chromobacterium sp. IIBBL 290-4]|uniref:hypothetical protein n=1 Tax=Chromobacterium sp. IIBBL 290-4 TaxID=2953890 RepID=UPI0020B7F9D1|nr:hypothetical protein [Chromobacterium sp. IIBBL 290-4]UTH75994.1 hypothetical protein NKT35_07780 [Chromobacterium sp. IIBBL 290-4]
MARPDKISRFLPLTFANGNSVRRFGKHCPQCRAMVGAEHMEGLASLMKGKIFLSADASCPRCQHVFPVACVITDDKRVHRVMLPLWMFRLWLKSATRNDPQPSDNDNWTVETEAPKGLELPADADVLRSDEIVGRFQGEPIFAWVEYQGQRFIFDRAAASQNLRLTPSELLLEGRLIYRQQ